MIGKLIGWTFDLIGRLWNGFWNVCGKLFFLLVFTALCGAAAVAVLKFSGGDPTDAWLYFKSGAALGLLLGGVRLLINEVAVPLVHAQEQRVRDENRRALEIRLAMERDASRRKAFSERFKTLD